MSDKDLLDGIPLDLNSGHMISKLIKYLENITHVLYFYLLMFNIIINLLYLHRVIIPNKVYQEMDKLLGAFIMFNALLEPFSLKKLEFSIY